MAENLISLSGLSLHPLAQQIVVEFGFDCGIAPFALRGILCRLPFLIFRTCLRPVVSVLQHCLLRCSVLGAFLERFPPPEITLGVLAPFFARATLAIAVSGRGGIPHWR